MILIGQKTSKKEYIKILFKNIAEDATRHKRANNTDLGLLHNDLINIEIALNKLDKVVASDKKYYYI